MVALSAFLNTFKIFQFWAHQFIMHFKKHFSYPHLYIEKKNSSFHFEAFAWIFVLILFRVWLFLCLEIKHFLLLDKYRVLKKYWPNLTFAYWVQYLSFYWLFCPSFAIGAYFAKALNKKRKKNPCHTTIFTILQVPTLTKRQ